MGPLRVAGAYLSSPEFRRTAILWFTGIFSVVDVCSDVYSTSSYFTRGRNDVAWALLSTILLSFAIQSMCVIYAHKHKGIREVALEICFVLCGMKPFVDTRRLTRMSAIAGAPAVPGAVMDQATERLICEVIEIVCEALPAAIIQVIL